MSSVLELITLAARTASALGVNATLRRLGYADQRDARTPFLLLAEMAERYGISYDEVIAALDWNEEDDLERE